MPKTSNLMGTIMSLGKNISKHRKRARMTQQDLADAIGVSYSRISEIENGRGNPRIGTIEKIADALQTTVSKLTREIVLK